MREAGDRGLTALRRLRLLAASLAASVAGALVLAMCRLAQRSPRLRQEGEM
ncbi:MAG: hypothetical protein ACM3JG_20315 [Thiohalocapsa sp.]